MRYIFGALAVIAIAIIAIALLIRSPAPNNGQKPGAKPVIKLLDYVNKSGNQVQWTIQGPLVGEDQKHSVRISISPNERRIEILDGYEQQIERSQTYSNSQAAYDTFLHALNLAGFNKDRKVANNEEKGVCPLGNLYDYDVVDGSDHPVHLWSSSCTTVDGPFAGNALLIRQVFQNQIPDYNTQIKGVKLQI